MPIEYYGVYQILLEERELKKKPRTIQNWRSMGDAPPFIRLGKQIYYPKADVRKWLRARLVQVT